MLLLGLVLSWQSFSSQSDDSLAIQHGTAATVAARAMAFVDQLNAALLATGRIMAIKGLSRDQQGKALSDLQQSEPAFEELALLDNAGQEQARITKAGIVPPDQLSNRADADVFRVSVDKRAPYFSAVRFQGAAAEPFVMMGLPLVDPSTQAVDGVIIAEVRLKRIWDIIATLETGPGESVYIVDDANNVVVHRDPSIHANGMGILLPKTEGRAGGLSGVPAILAFDRLALGEHLFYIVVERTEEVALAEPIGAIHTTLALVAFAIVVAGTMGFLVVRSIVQPIEALAATAKAITAGDLTKRATIARRDEVGALASAFNSMTDQLRGLIERLEERVQERTAELGRANQLLQKEIVERKQAQASEHEQRQLAEALLDIAALVNSTLDFNLVLDRVLSNIGHVVHHDAASMLLVEGDTARVVRHRGFAERGQADFMSNLRLSISETGSLRAIADTKKPLEIPDTRTSPEWLELPESRWILSHISTPILVQDRVIGFLNLESETPGFFTAADAQRLQAFAGQAAIALENARLLREAQQQMHEMQRLYDIGASLNSTLDLKAVLQQLTNASRELCGASESRIQLLRPDGKTWIRWFSSDQPENLSIDAIVQLHPTGISESVVSSGQPVIIPDIAADPRASPGARERGMCSQIGIPIQSNGKPIGAIIVNSNRLNAFGERDLQVLTFLSLQAGVAIQNARLFAETRQHASEFSALYAMAQELAAERDLSNLLQTIAERARSLLNAANGFIYLCDPAQSDLHMVVSMNPSNIVGSRLKLGEGMAGQVAQSRQPLWTDDYLSWEGRSPKYAQLSAIVEVPMLFSGELIGVLGVNEERKSTRTFAEADAQLLSLFASQAAGAVRNVQLISELRQRAAEMNALQETAVELVSELRTLPLLGTIIRRATELLGGSGGDIYEWEPSTGRLRCTFCYDPARDATGVTLSPGEGMAGRVYQSAQPLIVNDYAHWDGRAPHLRGIPSRAVISVPILWHSQVIGVINVNSQTGNRTFEDRDVRLLTLFANQAAIALENARLFAALEQELTERKRAEESLAQERNLLRTIIDNIPDPIYATDTEYRCILSNLANAAQFGHGRPDQIVGKTAQEHLPEKRAAQVIANDQEIFQSGRPMINCEEDFIDPNSGRHEWTLTTKVPLRDANGDITGLVGISRNVTHIKEAEQTLQLQTTRLQIALAVNTAATARLDMDTALPQVVNLIRQQFGFYFVGILLLDPEGHWASLRAASGDTASELLQRGVRVAVGGEGSLVGVATGTRRARVSQDVATDPDFAAEPLLPATRAEAVIPLMVGDTVIGALDVQSADADAFSDQVTSILCTIADQIAVAVQNTRLHATVSDRAHELEQAYRKLQENQQKLLIAEKMASLGRLTAGIAHEMNTPLAAVRGALSELDRLVDEYDASIPDSNVTHEDHREIAGEMRQSIQLAQKAAERSASFIRGIKTQTREPSAEAPQPFDAVPIIRETLLLLGHPLRKSNCTAVFETAAEAVILKGRPSRLAQVVTNLVTNAVDASADKGGGPITLNLNPHENGIELQVGDKGCGILPEIMDKIFDPLFTTKPFGQGTGLGLAIVHDIVVGDFGGKIEVSSKPGEGSTFHVHFPRVQEAT